MKRKDYIQQVSDKETAIIIEKLREVLANGIAGDVVEFGCYRGDTSLLMEKELERLSGVTKNISSYENKNKCVSEGDSRCEINSSHKSLWIYDSFEGLPARTVEDASVAGDGFSEGELLVSKREVVERFKKAGLSVPKIRKGFFENLDPGEIDTSGRVLRSSHDLPDRICFAFLDGDLYQSIRTSLELVSPRLVWGKNGNINTGAKCTDNTKIICGARKTDDAKSEKIQSVIIVHDYNNPQLPGVAKAVDEWIAAFSKQKTAPKLQRRESLAIISW